MIAVGEKKRVCKMTAVGSHKIKVQLPSEKIPSPKKNSVPFNYYKKFKSATAFNFANNDHLSYQEPSTNNLRENETALKKRLPQDLRKI